MLGGRTLLVYFLLGIHSVFGILELYGETKFPVNDDRCALQISDLFTFGPEGNYNVIVDNLKVDGKSGKDIKEDRKNIYIVLLPAQDVGISEAPGAYLDLCNKEDQQSKICTNIQNYNKGVQQNQLKSLADVPEVDSKITFSHDVKFPSPDELAFISNSKQAYCSKDKYCQSVLYLVNCNEGKKLEAYLDVKMYNMLNSKMNFLSYGETQLPGVHMILTFLYIGAFITWCVTLSRRKPHSHKIHYLMAVVLLVRLLTSFCLWRMYHDIRKDGRPEGWNFAFFFFTFLRTSLFFTVVVLIGTGWSFMSDYLSPNVKRMVLALIPMQVLTTIAITVFEEAPPSSVALTQWHFLFYLLDVISCCLILFPIVWSINHLRATASIDGKATRCLLKLRQFRFFYILVVAFIYSTRIISQILRIYLSPPYHWVADFSSELITFGFYVSVGYLFRPAEQNPYLTIENAEEIIEMEGF